MDAQQKSRLAAECTRRLIGHGRAPARTILEELAAVTEASLQPDMYGEGSLIRDFEQEVATLLGHPAAVFMPSGTMAQQIALRIHADRRGVPRVAFHPTCHLEIHEQKGYQLLHGLHGVPVGPRHGLLTLDDLKKIPEPLAALLLELPQREVGGLLPPWNDLVAITGWARERGIARHLDGARLWECQPFYQRPYAEIAGLFDTVYVSFYKILGGITGAMLLGPEEIIAEARVWQRRHGGNLVQMFPFVLSAQHGLHTRLGRIGLYRDKAVEIASILTSLPGIEVKPDPPQVNMMHVFVRGDAVRLEQAALDLAREEKAWLVGGFAPSQLPAWQMFELTVGDGALEFTAEEIRRLFASLLERARS